MTYRYDILENSEEGIVKVGEKEVYNLDSGVDEFMSDWLREDIKNLEISNLPKMSSSLEIKEKGDSKSVKGEIAHLSFKSNQVGYNATEVYITSSCATKSGFSITKANFHKAIAGFSARRLIQSNVWNDKDEYMKPSDTILDSIEYKQWNNDCIIYSLFDNQSFQSSLRQIDYQSKKWDIINEFFWLSSDTMLKLAESINWIEMIDDIDENGKERFVYEEIERIKLLDSSLTFSSEAMDLLNYATELITKSIKHRKLMSDNNEEYHLKSFDAGYAQLKLVWKEYFKEEFKELIRLRMILANKLRPKVYEFGFLFK